MPVVLGNGTITGLTAPGVNSGSVQLSNFAAGSLYHTYDFTKKATLVTGITDSNTTVTRTYTLSDYFVMPADVVGVILRVRYQHNGGANHGYLSLNSYKTGYSSNYIEYVGIHFDWYFNTTNEQFIVPWVPGSPHGLTILCYNSYNTSSSNTYDIYVDGIIRASTN